MLTDMYAPMMPTAKLDRTTVMATVRNCSETRQKRKIRGIAVRQVSGWRTGGRAAR